MSGTTTPTSDLSTFLGTDPGLERLYDNVQSSVPAVTLSLVKLAAWNTIEEFYLRSTAKRELVFWQMAPGVQSIDFNPFDANWLVAWLLDFCGLFSWKVDMPGCLIDLNQPLQQRQGTALLALKPASFSAAFPQELFVQWFEVILDGVLFRLYGQPAKPYSSPQLAQYHGQRYRRGIADARSIAQRQYTNGPGRWNFPREQGFAMGRRKQ
jgi:hypothetical protein